jgi:hypothetical protein
MNMSPRQVIQMYRDRIADAKAILEEGGLTEGQIRACERILREDPARLEAALKGFKK